MEAVILATVNLSISARLRPGLAVRLCISVFTDEAVAFDRAAAVDHHVAILFLGHSRHAARHLLVGFAVGRAHAREEINVTAKLDTPAEVTRKHSLLLLLGHRP